MTSMGWGGRDIIGFFMGILFRLQEISRPQVLETPFAQWMAGMVVAFVIPGWFIFLDRPFVIADLVETEGIYGRLERLLLTRVRGLQA